MTPMPGDLPQRSTGPILKLPEAIEKLEELVLSVAQHHLKTIELFGAIIGFFIGVGQAHLLLVHVSSSMI